MRLTRAGQRKTKARQIEDVILFVVNEQRFAIAANAVDEIRNLEGIAPHTYGLLHSKLAKVKYTLIREKKDPEKLYFVVDTASHFEMKSSAVGRILVLRNSSVALLVEGIDRMTQINTVVELPMAFSGLEREWYRGLAVLGDQVVPVVNPDSFLSKAEQAVLLAAQRGAAAAKALKGVASA